MTKNSREIGDYFELALDLNSLVQTWPIGDIFYYKDLQQRKLFLNGVITSESVEDPIHQILQFNKDDELNGIAPEDRRPIILYITSVGGSDIDGFALIDVIEASKTPIYTVNVGYEYSMAFLIGLFGHKRFCFKNSRFLLHEGYGGMSDSTSKMFDAVEFCKRIENRIKDIVISKTSISEELYNEKLRVEWYMLSDEAKELGVVDYIIGKDCDINEVI